VKARNRSRVASALPHSEGIAYKPPCGEWGGWGRLSDDGPGHYNPDPSEGPRGKAVHYRVRDPTQCGNIGVTTRCTKGEGKPNANQRMPGAGLS
jgi:hypothetical protein